MRRPAVQHESFILRIWQAVDQPSWRGWVQHTGSGESTVVRTVQELVAFIEQRTGKLDDSQRHGLQ